MDETRGSLRQVVESHRVVVTVGSGGVGKTTTAAAIAMHAAMQGKKVLCLTIDPARRLANSLGLDEMTVDEQEVPAELFTRHGLELKGELSAMMLDTKRTFDELVAEQASSPEIRDKILNNEIYKYVAGSLAGTQEYMAMEKLHSVRQDPRWDLIVLDTPPTSNALDFLDAPDRLIDAIDSPAMRWFIQAFQGAGKFSFGMVGKGAAFLLRGLSKFTGAGFLEQIAEFVSGINDLFGGFRDRATEVGDALRSPEVAFVVVTSPAPLSIAEAIFFSERLKEAGMRRDGVVVNGVHALIPEPSAKGEVLEAALQEAAPDLEAPGKIIERMHQALQDERLRGVADRIETDRLKNRVGDEVVYVEVPKLEEDVHDLGGLATIASHLVP
ncbi:MAG: anion-transporting ATPase [Sandaracinus sp.]|nr:anion-transporting ATPase [Sandaracinus sp.]